MYYIIKNTSTSIRKQVKKYLSLLIVDVRRQFVELRNGGEGLEGDFTLTRERQMLADGTN